MNSFGSLRKRCLVAASIALAAIAIPIPASAASQTTASEKIEHCLLTVTGKDAKGTFITAPMKCYSTFAGALRAAGPAVVPDSITGQQAKEAGVLTADSIIGVHYEYANGNGSTLTVNGTNCSGGGLNVPLSWNDRISSTLNGCPTIIHYEHTNYTGSSFSCFGVGSVNNVTGFMDNKTSSILYYS